jgi:hypothetical protein
MESKQLKWVYLVVLAARVGSSFDWEERIGGVNGYAVGFTQLYFTSIFLVLLVLKVLLKYLRSNGNYIALTSLFGTFYSSLFICNYTKRIDSSVSSILNSLTPLNTLVIGTVLVLQFKRNQTIGIRTSRECLLILNGLFSSWAKYYYAIRFDSVNMLCWLMWDLIKYLHDLSPLSITTGNFIVLFSCFYRFTVYNFFFWGRT